MELWIGTIELSYCSARSPSVRKKAFTVVTTWARSAEEFAEKCGRMLEEGGWCLLGVEKAVPVAMVQELSEEAKEMIERTRADRDAVIHGTFYTYPVS